MPGAKHTLRISRAEFQKLQKNSNKLENKEANANNRSREKEKNGLDGACVIFITFYISDRRIRDLDGMVSTVFDTLIESGIIKDDRRQMIPMFIPDYELCEKGNEGFRVRIITL